MDHVPNKEVTRAVGWGRGGGGQTPNHGSVQMETRRSGRQLPRAHAGLLDPGQPLVEVARGRPCSLNPP